MSLSTSGRDDDAPDLVCQIDCVHGMVDALSSVRWKRHQVRCSLASPSFPHSTPNPIPSTYPIPRPPVAQDAVMELSAHGIVLTVEESGCLQAKVFLKREVSRTCDARQVFMFMPRRAGSLTFIGIFLFQLFVEYDYAGDGRERFGLSLGLFVDCLNIFSSPGHASAVEIRYPGPDMQLLLKYVFAMVLMLCSYTCIASRIVAKP